jgi:hypothetical protein
VIDLLSAGRSLVESLGKAGLELPAAGSPGERARWVESLAGHLSPEEAWTVLEHLFGVLPLADAFFDREGAMAEVAAGTKLTALGLFTPTPELGWQAAAIEGKQNGHGTRLHGEVRLPSPVADGSLVLVRLAGTAEHRLAWVDHDGPGVEWRNVRSGHSGGAGAPAGRQEDAPCWLAMDGATIPPELLSRPVSLGPDGALFRCLDAYAGIWSLAAALCARDGVHALRRAARTTVHRGKAFNTSQWVSLGITEMEIEADLAAAAARRHLQSSSEGGGLLVAAASARALQAVAAKTAELRDSMGLEAAGPLAEGSARILTAFLGGALLLEHELSRTLGIRDLPAEEAGV